jgi:hypothetical protein
LKCTCGATGRVALKISSSGSDDDESSKLKSGVSPGFGIHTVLSAGYENSRAKASGNLTVAQIEAIVDEQWSTTEYNPWHDHHLALYSASGLDSYISAFKADSVGFMTMNTTSAGTVYYSILVHIPKTQVILELVSKTKPTVSTGTASLRGASADDILGFVRSEEERFYVSEAMMAEFDDAAAAASGILTPLHVSRAVEDVDEIITFYKNIFGISPEATVTLPDGGKSVSFLLSSKATVPIKFVQRPDAKEGEHSVAWFQDYLNDVNDEYMTSYKSCWPVWGDNHHCLDDQSVDGATIIAKYKANAGKRGYHYHLFGMGRGGNGYFADPSGFQFQLDVQMTVPSDAEKFSPDYCMKSCASTEELEGVQLFR